MRVVWSPAELREFVGKATRLSPDRPVVVSKFEQDAQEIELDAVASDGEVIVWAVSEHVERAGVHSGDATLVFPPQSLTDAVIQETRKVGQLLARALAITGPFNVQLLVKQGAVKVIECNLRASRSMPFISKALGVNFITEAVRAMLGVGPSRELIESHCDPDYVVVKAPQFSFDRLRGAQPRLGVEMASTGEVACFGETKAEALLKAMLARGFEIPVKGALLAFESVVTSFPIVEEASWLKARGLRLFALPDTAASLASIDGVEQVAAVDGSAQRALRDGLVDVVFTGSAGASGPAIESILALERLAIDLGIPVVSEPALVRSVIQALVSTPLDALQPRPWRSYLTRRSTGRTRYLPCPAAQEPHTKDGRSASSCASPSRRPRPESFPSCKASSRCSARWAGAGLRSSSSAAPARKPRRRSAISSRATRGSPSPPARFETPGWTCSGRPTR